MLDKLDSAVRRAWKRWDNVIGEKPSNKNGGSNGKSELDKLGWFRQEKA